ncbi:hypothetical protein CMU73_03820 [Elizabethkingia anophelis]|uniref:Uncharacterized protein n=1 Tax=Elizabethkingia anophelis TaxID=1117645 RepID=A0A455ZCG9_9FLAO|nr:MULTISPECIES: hypothetical protein [Bacteroidota]ASV79742.1 hypothetical protein A6J37_14575 [Elizabethkingia anophelis]MBB1642541.1 hypothetical protein [Sphingobacterium sp. UME9]MDV3551403.1 hypothetical protein [Elizabethkingia anophelis]MDV3569769.1 hypothetical protein [Elizabethkingia anophelis]MDV3619326.1 hypothetical protein [Elizabethkingia anophelis]
MYITDLNGFQIEVTDLDDAIRITAENKQNEHENQGFSKLDKRLNNYWTDMYEKLKAIKEQITTIKISEQ